MTPTFITSPKQETVVRISGVPLRAWAGLWRRRQGLDSPRGAGPGRLPVEAPGRPAPPWVATRGSCGADATTASGHRETPAPEPKHCGVRPRGARPSVGGAGRAPRQGQGVWGSRGSEQSLCRQRCSAAHPAQSSADSTSPPRDPTSRSRCEGAPARAHPACSAGARVQAGGPRPRVLARAVLTWRGEADACGENRAAFQVSRDGPREPRLPAPS